MRECKIVRRLEIPPSKASFVALGLVLPCSSEKIRAIFPVCRILYYSRLSVCLHVCEPLPICPVY